MHEGTGRGEEGKQPGGRSVGMGFAVEVSYCFKVILSVALTAYIKVRRLETYFSP